MLNFNSIRQKIADIDYGFNLQTLIVLVPGLSLLAQKIKVQSILRFAEQNNPVNFIGSRESAQIDHVYKWHAIGSAIQIAVFGLLTKVYPLPSDPRVSLFAIPCLLALYQFQNALLGYLGDRTVIHLSPNGGQIRR